MSAEYGHHSLSLQKEILLSEVETIKTSSERRWLPRRASIEKETGYRDVFLLRKKPVTKTCWNWERSWLPRRVSTCL